MKNHKAILRFINDQIFAEPLDDKEFNTVSRDEKIKAEKNNQYEVAMQLKKKLKIVKFCDRLYSYDGVHYQDGIYFKHDIAIELAGQNTRYIEEVIKQIDIHTSPIVAPSNGIYVMGIGPISIIWNLLHTLLIFPIIRMLNQCQS
ncbi:hypothetical protein [Salipaludibacillus sp. CF4.18]|uniref:hypothetical protein n=1 Tax=Salipaludibacillus sp. CF4.18 TaxID=3373081 RepID=UPI003EE5C3F6